MRLIFNCVRFQIELPGDGPTAVLVPRDERRSACSCVHARHPGEPGCGGPAPWLRSPHRPPLRRPPDPHRRCKYMHIYVLYVYMCEYMYPVW